MLVIDKKDFNWFEDRIYFKDTFLLPVKYIRFVIKSIHRHIEKKLDKGNLSSDEHNST